MTYDFSLRGLCGCIGLGLLLGMLPGCDKDHDEGQAAGPRPVEIESAYGEVQSGNAASAQQHMESYLVAEPQKSPHRAEAHFVLGQALVAQGRFEDGKKQFDAATETDDRTLKGMAMLRRADCNMSMQKYPLATSQYHWLDTMYRDVKGIPQDEVLFKLGMATKKSGFPDTANYWFNQVINLYATGKYAEDAKRENTRYTPTNPDTKPLVYSLKVSEFTSRERADTDADAFRAKGYKDVEVVDTTRNSFSCFEVHVGKFENKIDAVRAQTDAELAGLNPSIRPNMFEPLK